MNFRIASLILLPLAGFGLGWWTRGPVDREVGPGAVREAGVDSGRAPVPSEGSVRPGKRQRVVEEAFTEADRRREEEDRRRMQETCRRKLEIKVEEWGRLLDLSAAEFESLRGAIGPAMEGLDPPVAELALPGLEEILKSMLQGERSIALEQLVLRRREALASAKVEARLAEISAVLLLDPEQQVELRENLAGKVEHLPDPSGRAIPGLSPESLAEINQRLAEAQDGNPDDESAFRRITGDVVRENIDADLDGLAEILSPDQLAAYRQHLEEVHAQWLLPVP
jgi:hypothetical protein